MAFSKVLEKRTPIGTQITDLPEIAVELWEEMRIVSGGIASTARACTTLVYPAASAPSNTSNDPGHDTDWPFAI